MMDEDEGEKIMEEILLRVKYRDNCALVCDQFYSKVCEIESFKEILKVDVSFSHYLSRNLKKKIFKCLFFLQKNTENEFIDNFDSMMYSRRRFSHLRLSGDFSRDQEDELTEVLAKYGSEIKVAAISLCQRNLKQFLKVLKRLPKVEELEIQGYHSLIRETKLKDDEDIVKLAELKRLKLNVTSVEFMDFFQEFIPNGVLAEMELTNYDYDNRSETFFLSVLSFFDSQCNIKKLKVLGELEFDWIGHLKLEEFSANVKQTQQQEVVSFLVTQRNLKAVDLEFRENIESATLIQIIQSLSNVRKLKFTLKTIDVESLRAIQQLQLRYLQDFELELNGDVSAVGSLEAVELKCMKKLKLSPLDDALIELSNESISRLAQRFPTL
jgi:hypothetical protein